MLHVALYQPEIPPNTGNVIRLCANAGAKLHLIHPLGFALDNKRMLRAGLDYHELTHVHEHDDYDNFINAMSGHRIIACETGNNTAYCQYAFQDHDVLLFGPETRGLPDTVHSKHPCVHIPMRAGSRSLNLSNSVAIVLFDAWRQLGFSML